MATKPTMAEETWISWGWSTVPGMDIFVSHTAEKFNCRALDPSKRRQTAFWTLDYLFTPGQIKVGRGRWEKRRDNAAYLIPRYTEWSEKPVTHRDPAPHRVELIFATRHNAKLEDERLKGRRLDYLLYLDPDRVIANAMIEVAATAKAAGDEGYWAVQTIAWEFLQVIWKARVVSDGVREVRSTDLKKPLDPMVTRALAYFQGHLRESIDIGDVARHLNVGASTLSHRFTECLGHGPMKELQRLRILRAKALLRQGWKLDAIAKETGFYDGFYLSRVFKQCEGVSPLEFGRSTPSSLGG